MLVLKERQHVADRVLVLRNRQFSKVPEHPPYHRLVIKALGRTSDLAVDFRKRFVKKPPELNLLLRRVCHGLGFVN